MDSADSLNELHYASPLLVNVSGFRRNKAAGAWTIFLLPLRQQPANHHLILQTNV